MSAPVPDVSLGPIELGVLVSTSLYGVMAVQSYTYYQARFNDGWLLKGLVIFVLLVESFHTIDLWVYLYRLTVTDFGNFSKLQEEHWTLGISVPTSTIVVCAVQCFFAIRVYRLSQKLWYALFTCSLCLIQLAGGVAIFILTFQIRTIPTFGSKYFWLMSTTMSIAAFVDVCNTGALCYLLYKFKMDALATRNQRLIDKLLRWTIETGLLTSAMVTAMVITLGLLPRDNFLFLFFFCVTTKSYSNSLLASLNNRVGLRENYDREFSCVHLGTIKSTIQFRCPLEDKNSEDAQLNLAKGTLEDVLASHEYFANAEEDKGSAEILQARCNLPRVNGAAVPLLHESEIVLKLASSIVSLPMTLSKLKAQKNRCRLNNRKCLREQNARDWPIQLSTARSFPDFAQQLDVRVDVVESRFIDKDKDVPDADGKADFDVGSRMHRSASFSHEV